MLPHELRRGIYQLRFPAQIRRRQTLRNSDAEYSLRGFDTRRCIFVHVPKTGGVSVAKSLFGHLVDHKPLREYQLIFSANDYRKYFKFAFVRNPWARLVSAYTFLKAGGLNADDAAWAKQYLAPYLTFEQFVKSRHTKESVQTAKHFRPQYLFLQDARQNMGLDFVGRFETLQEDFQTICGRLGVEVELLHLNEGKKSRSDFRSFYTPETVTIVREIYRQDIEQFGYTFDTS